MSFRTYRDVTGPDRSQLGAQVGAQRARITERLAPVLSTVAVMSGKGGVGKSFVTASLALGAARRRSGGVGVVDADLKSPTMAHLLGARGPIHVSESGVQPAEGAGGVRVMSSAFLLEDGQPLTWREHPGERFVWRGVLEAGALREFLGDVEWGALDLLLVDLPPGADRLSDLAELYPLLAGAIAVTIPSAESHASVRRAMLAAQRAGVPLLGVIENMSGYACDGCATTRPLFAGNAGVELAEEFAVPLLARIPFRAGAGDEAAPITGDEISDAVISALFPMERAVP
ncbi:MAG: Mrp/NBP35 family ATP-binding protein [Gemmatimonadaceae bacterium]